MEKFEVIIIGAGPAGLRAAKVLASAGKKVLVLEKNSVVGPKICAGGAFSAVYKEGIPEDLIGRKFNLIKLHLSGRTYEIKGKGDYLLSTLDRGGLGQWMAKEAEKSGAKILTNSQVISIERSEAMAGDRSPQGKVVLKNGQIFYFDYLIGADGGSSLVRNYLKLPIKFALCYQYTLPQHFENLEVFYDSELFGAGYAWIFPHRNSTKIGCGSDLKFHNGNKLKENFHSWLKNKGINYQGAELEGHIINYNYRGYQFQNMFLIGEAAGFVSGLSGAGIYAGLISGQEIVKKILNPKYRPKIALMLTSQKLQEKLLDFLNLNQRMTKYLIQIIVFYFFFSNRFFNLFKKSSLNNRPVA